METPLINISKNAVVSSSGLVGTSFILDSPEPYSLSFEAIERNVLEQVRALNMLGEDIYYHRIDSFESQIVDGQDYFLHDDYLNKAESDYFTGRERYRCRTIISFFIAGLKTLSKEYMASPFTIRESLEIEERNKLRAFESNVKNAVNLFRGLRNTNIRPIEEQELRTFLFRYINGFNRHNTVHPASFSDEIKIGENYFRIFSFSSPNHFSKEHTIIENDVTLPNSQYVFRNIFDELGIHFKTGHLLNQIVHIPHQENTKNILEIRKASYMGWKDYKASINDGYKELLAFEGSVQGEDNKICMAHNNLMLYHRDRKVLEMAAEKASEIFSSKGLMPFDARYQYAQNIFNSSVIGRHNELNSDQYYMSSLRDCVGMAPTYGNFREDKKGFIFQDRVFRAPIVTDILDLDRKHIAARNGMFISPTGEGKSSSLLNLCYQLILNDVKLVCVEFGESFGFLVKLFKERAVHIKLRPNEPLGINPFRCAGKEVTSAKIVSVTGFVLKLWRKNLEMVQNEGTFFVTLQNIVKNYYGNSPDNPSMQDFYDYVLQNWEAIKRDEGLKEKFFDIDEFELILGQFVEGGLYHFVCLDNIERDGDIASADLVVYELSEIKKDPFLLSIILTSLEDTVNSNILSDRSRLGGVIFEEFGETAELRDIFGGGDVLSSVAWLYQKIRKENGFIWTILQNIKQLPDNQYTQNIISNVQLLMTNGLTEKVTEDIVKAFKIKNQEHINLMKSVKKNFSGFPKWSELCIRWGESRIQVVRQEFPIEKFLAFQTDGETWDYMNKDYALTGDMITTIENTKKHFGHEKNDYHTGDPVFT